MELVFWLTRKLSWKDGLNTLIMSLIGHQLSMVKLSTDYHMGNVIRCLMSSQPFLKQWKQENSCQQAGGPPVAEKLTSYFTLCEEKKAISQEFKNATIIHLFRNWRVISHYVKKKSHLSRIQGCNNYPLIQKERDPQGCDNHRCISLLSIAGKILASVLLKRLNEQLGQSGLLPESQCGFRKDRGTIDMIFTARQLQEKCQEQNVDLYMTFVDTKTFDKVVRDFGKLWQRLAVLPNS